MISMQAIKIDYRPLDWTSFSKHRLIGPIKIDMVQDQFNHLDSLMQMLICLVFLYVESKQTIYRT